MLVLRSGGGTPGGGQIAGVDDFSFVEGVTAAGLSFFSPVDMGTYFGPTRIVSTNDGGFTSGVKFTPFRACTMTGVRFYWKSSGAGAQTIRCKLWLGTGTVESKDITVNASGVYTAVFDTPRALNAFEGYYATVYNPTAGSYHTQMSIDPVTGPQGEVPIISMVPLNAYTLARNYCRFSAGDAVPSNTSTAVMYLVEPVLTL